MATASLLLRSDSLSLSPYRYTFFFIHPFSFCVSFPAHPFPSPVCTSSICPLLFLHSAYTLSLLLAVNSPCTPPESHYTPYAVQSVCLPSSPLLCLLPCLSLSLVWRVVLPFSLPVISFRVTSSIIQKIIFICVLFHSPVALS